MKEGRKGRNEGRKEGRKEGTAPKNPPLPNHVTFSSSI
jgi:hypothetical protein